MFLWSYTCGYHHAFNPHWCEFVNFGFLEVFSCEENQGTQENWDLVFAKCQWGKLFVFHDIK